MSDTTVVCSALSFSWPDGTPVVTDLSFTVGDGRTGLVAPNGAGKVETFAMSMSETIVALFEQEAAKIGKQPAYMTTGEKKMLVKALKESGVFQIRGGVDQVAHLLGITRYTVYNYLNREQANRS